MKTDEGAAIPWAMRYGKGKLQDFLWNNPDPHVCGGKINIGHKYWAYMWVVMEDGSYETWERLNELLRLLWGLVEDRRIETATCIIVD